MNPEEFEKYDVFARQLDTAAALVENALNALNVAYEAAPDEFSKHALRPVRHALDVAYRGGPGQEGLYPLAVTAEIVRDTLES